MNFKRWSKGVGAVVLLATGLIASAQETASPLPTQAAKQRGTAPVTTLPTIVVTAQAPGGFSSVAQSTTPVSERYQLPQSTHSTDASVIHQTVNITDTEDAVKYFPQPLRAQAQQRRSASGAGHADVGPQLQRAQPGLRRRHPALGADRQQQHQLRAALGPGLAGGNLAHRFPLRSLRRGLSRKLGRRRAPHHDEDAGQVDRRRIADRVVPDFRPLQHKQHVPHRRVQHRHRRQERRRLLARHRQLREQLLATARLRDQRVGAGWNDGRDPGAEQDRRTGRCGGAPAACCTRST